ncbi:MAG: hypothetical protein K6L73_09760 [Cellvibrionaceae bacterium]
MEDLVTQLLPRSAADKLIDVGRWTLDVGRWTLDVGRWTLDVGRWTLDKLCHSERSEESFFKIHSCLKKILPHAVHQDDKSEQAFPRRQKRRSLSAL